MFFMAAHLIAGATTMRTPRVYGKPVTSDEEFRHCPRNGKWKYRFDEKPLVSCRG
jgi:hypothetical protein